MLHCLHNAFLSISGELGTGDLICSSVQPKADLLLFTCFPVTYRRRWHLRPDGALTFSTAEQAVLVLLRLLLNTRYPYIMVKAAQSDSGGRENGDLALRMKDQGQVAGSMPTIEGLGLNLPILILPGMAASTPSPRAVSFLPQMVATALNTLYTVGSSGRSALQGLWTVTRIQHATALLVLSAPRSGPVWGKKEKLGPKYLACTAHESKLHTHALHRGGFQNRRKWGILGTIKKVSNEILRRIFKGDFWERLKENFQAKLRAITDILKHKYVLKSWTRSKLVKK